MVLENGKKMFRAGLAALSIVAGPESASAETPRLLSGPEPAHRGIAARTPSPEDGKHIERYLALREKLKGVYLKQEGPVVTLPQFDEFCRELEIFCRHFTRRHEDSRYKTEFAPDNLATIYDINRKVNEKIKPMEDIHQYGVIEKWTIPADAGDCEDYVLLKKAWLITDGFDSDQLHIMVVKDSNGRGHAVLGVDLFLDGKRNTLVLDNNEIGEARDEIITVDEMLAKYTGLLNSFVTRDSAGETNVRFFNFARGR